MAAAISFYVMQIRSKNIKQINQDYLIVEVAIPVLSSLRKQMIASYLQLKTVMNNLKSTVVSKKRPKGSNRIRHRL